MTIDIALALLLLAGSFAAFLTEKLAPDTVAMGALVLALGLGLIDSKDALSAFANPAPVTIACMFVLSAALERTGCLDLVGRLMGTLAGTSHLRALAAVMAVVIPLSAFMNNTPIVVVLTPVVIGLARQIGLAPSRLLIPLSYAAILGGTTTLIGTSTNLSVNGAALQHGVSGFGMFEITGVGAVLALIGTAYMVLAGRFLLPARRTIKDSLEGRQARAFMAKAVVPRGSRLVGRKLGESGLQREDCAVLDVLRRGKSLRKSLDEIVLAPGDIVVMEVNAGDMLALMETGEIVFDQPRDGAMEPLEAEETVVMEGMVGPNSSLAGRLIGELNLRENFGVYVIGLHNDDRDFARDFDHIRLGFGDTLLIEGPADGIRRLVEGGEFVNLSRPRERPIRRRKAPLAVAALVAVVGLAAFNVMPIEGLALIAAFAVAVFGCLDAEEAYRAVNWRIVFLIIGMLGLSLAMEKSGAARMIVDWSMGLAQQFGPHAMLAAIYLVAMLLTEMVSNNAVALLLTPIVIDMAARLGVDPKPFLAAVMFAASASFATPIGYQTNTFVYNAGGYRFRDFLRVGLPLNLLLWVASVLLIPLFWKL
jgi:di/tricarboxylate transporter